jgi:hypothetical protein
MVSVSSSHYFHNLLFHPYALSVPPISSTFSASEIFRFIFYGRMETDSKMIHPANQSQIDVGQVCGVLRPEWLFRKMGMTEATYMLSALDFSLRFRLFDNMTPLCHKYFSSF